MLYLPAAYNGAYDQVSGKCARYWDILNSARSSGFHRIVSTLVPKSIEEVVEVRDPFSLYTPSNPSLIDIQVAYLLKSAARPETIPTCIATIGLVKSTNQGFIYALQMMFYHARSIGDQLHNIRQLYEIHEIQNKVPNGTISFPEDSRSLASGITVEFRHVASSSRYLPFQAAERLPIRNVSFRYPDKNDFALRDVSFKIEKGQLCVSSMLSTSRVSGALLTLER